MSSAEEARLLYTLLESARDEGRFSQFTSEQRWLELQQRFDASQPEAAHAELLALFRELERTGALVGTWIQFHWSRARAAPQSNSPTALSASKRPPA